ncbi:polymorphic toxin-type HINT domain-containing protein [Streptomyces sp. NPDC096079]|uniref:polymorphic toxin-type HINT domain-containing protein n=1 Tax=Streptomyces sp. NPDC096079 TaxID=3155820 RepID=UPI003327A40B
MTVAERAVGRRVGVAGPVLTLSEAAAAPSADHKVAIAVDLTAAGASGWLDRARLVALPACALTTPERSECRTRTSVASHIDTASGVLTADVALAPVVANSAPRPATRTLTDGATPHTRTAASPALQAGATRVDSTGTATVLAVESEASGAGGSYSATPLSPSAAWSASGNTGGFSYSYPIQLPAALGGGSPAVTLGYDSSGVDGRNSAQNPQSSWVGEGWGYDPGFIERSYKGCDKAGIDRSKDLCWGGHNATISLAGHSGTLVRDDATGTWRLQNDDGTRIERLTGASNGLHDGEYWKVTTSDGIRYYFGLDHLPGGDGTDPATHSAWGVPVYSPSAGDPCHDASAGTGSWCRMGWRWSLDHVVDAHGNLITQRYDTDVNHYSRGGGQNNGNGSLEAYERDGRVRQIDYGLRLSEQIAAKGSLKPAARITFGVAERCKASGDITCAESQRTSANQSYWPDVPIDQLCASSGTCTNQAPSFFSTKRLASITTEVLVGDALTPVDSWTLTHTFPDPGDGTKPALWLSGIKRTGGSGASALSLPEVKFTARQLANRVDGLTPAQPAFNRPRIQLITTETGGRISVNYSDPACSRTKGILPASADSNTKPCMPVKWYLPGSSSPDPVDDWFNKYLVTGINEQDAVTGSLVKTTAYTYNGDAAWHRNNAEFTDPKVRTWDDFRGYGSVDTITGSAYPGEAPQTRQRTTFLRGMDGDVKADGSTRAVAVANPLGGAAVTDDDWLAGTALATEIFDKADGTVQSASGHTSGGQQVTARRKQSGGMPDLIARYPASETTELTKDRLTDGSWRTLTKVTTSDPANANRVVTVDDRGDGTAATPRLCTSVTYASAADSALSGLVADKTTVTGACGATPTTANTVSSTRTLFDGKPFGQAGSAGDPTSSQVLDRYDTDGKAIYAHAGSSVFDAYGRVTSVSQSDGATFGSSGALLTAATVPSPATTRTEFSPAAGAAPTKVITTGPMGSGWTTTVTQDPGRAQPLTSTDPNGRTTTQQYDSLGRLTAVWTPERSVSLSPSWKFSYVIDGVNGPSATRSEWLQANGVTYSSSVVLYDGLGRERQTQRTSDAKPTGRLITDTVYDSHGWPVKTAEPYYEPSSLPTAQVFLPGNDSQVPAQTWTSYDGVGRAVRAEFRSYANLQWATTTAYPGADRTDVTPPSGSAPMSTVTDARGQTVQKWQYRTPTATGNPADADVTTYRYTPAGKIASQTDSSNITWTYEYDLRGRETSAVDPDSGARKTYYDVNSLVDRTEDANGRTIAYTRDLLGRTTGTYAGSVAPANQLAGWTYDTLPGAKGQPVASTRYVGGATGAAYTKAVTGYDTGYRPLGTSVTIPAAEGALQGTYTTKYTYHPVTGAVATLALPAAGGLVAETIGYTYLDTGLLTTAKSLGKNLISAMQYDALARPVRTTVGELGKQVVSTQQYDWATGRLINSIVDRESGTTHVGLTSYTYTPSGRVTSIKDLQDGTATDTQCFTYDHLSRLTGAWTDTGGTHTTADWTDSSGIVHGTGSSTSVPGTGGCDNAAAPGTTGTGTRTVGGPAPYWQTYTYDATGNRKSLTQHDLTGDATKDVITTQTFGTGPNKPTTAPDTGGGTGGPHALLKSTTTSPSGTKVVGYQYDAKGNTTSITDTAGTAALTWSSENRLDRLKKTQEPTGTTYLYDADGNELIRRNPGSSTLNLPTDQITLTGTSTLSNARSISAPGGLTLTRTSTAVGGSKLQVQVSDHHGTNGLQIGTDIAQTVTRRPADPFGSPRGTQPAATGWAGDKGFVGGSKDELTGLTNLGARKYDPAHGRFISPDPLLDPDDPQQWNGYAYSNNNPVNLSDPSGLIAYDSDTGIAAGGNSRQIQEAVNNVRSKPGYTDPQPVTDAGSKGYSPTDCRHTNSCATTLHDRAMNSFLNAVELSFNHDYLRNGKNTSSAEINRILQKYNNGYTTVSWAAVQMWAFGATEEETDYFYANYCLFIECKVGLDYADTPMGNGVVSPFGPSPQEKFGANIGASLEGGLGARGGRGKAGPGGRGSVEGFSKGALSALCGRKTDSFTGETLVSVEGGKLRPIAQVKVGDKVLATDPQTGKTVYRTVTAVIVTPDDSDFTDLTIESPRGTGTLTTTWHHPFWNVTTGRWTDASELKTGDSLRRPDGTTARVLRVRNHHQEVVTYNLTVADVHTYYVVAGSTPVLVHNSNCGPEMTGVNVGKKWGRHSKDYDLNPKDPAAREWYKNRAIEVRGAHDEVRQGPYNPDAGGGIDYWFYRQGNDLVITKGDGSFVTMFPLEPRGNGWWNGATPRQCTC